MNKLCLLFIILFIQISAQSEISGIAYSDAGKPLVRANVILLDADDNIKTFGFTDKTGSFLLSTYQIGQFALKITALNYHAKTIEVNLDHKNKKIDLGNLQIDALKETEIKEVIITRKNPIRISKDTIEYKAERFDSGTELSVEDILKNLPGIKIDNQGKIKFGDKEVERVMVENDDLFERGYQTLTQNMPSKSLDKVQVLQNYSKNKLLKNIEKSESVAINLTLKEDAKGKWFGSLLLASTSYKENMHQGKINIMNFTKRKKIYLLYNQNNLGLNEMNGVQYLINPSSDKDVENIGGNLQTLSVVNLHRKNYQFEDNRTNFNNDRLASFSYIYNFPRDWKIKLVSIFNEIENRNYINSIYQYNYAGINFTNIENKTWQQNNQNIVGKLEISKDFKKEANLVFYNKISHIKENNNNNFIFNDQLNQQIGYNRLFSTENKLVYTKKIDSSKAFVTVAKYLHQDRPHYFDEDNNLFQNITGNPNAERIHQNIDSKMSFGGAKFSYLKKYSDEQNLEIQLGNEYRKDVLQSDLSILDAENQSLVFDNAPFLNNTQLIHNNTFTQGKYNFKIKKWKYNFALRSELISSHLNNEENTAIYLSPTIGISYELKRNKSISLNASRSYSETSITQLYQNYIYQGDRSFRSSTFGFQLIPDNSVGLSFSSGDQLTKNINFGISYLYYDEFISNNAIINQNYSFHQNILVQDNTNIFAHFEVRRYLKFIKSRFSLLGNFMSSKYQNSVNNQPLIESQFNNYKIGFEMKSGWLKKINYELGYDWSFNKISSEANNNSYLDQKGFFNLYYNFTQNLKLQSNFEYYLLGNTTQKTTQFWDVKIDYMIKKQKMNLFLKGNNLLNSNSIQRYSLTNISESIYTQRLLPLHVVFGINITF